MAYFICEKQGRCCPHEFYNSIEQAITDSEDGVPCDYLIEVAQVNHGRWIAPFLSDGGNMCAECSNCHRIRILDDYCSACGAIMDLNDLED